MTTLNLTEQLELAELTYPDKEIGFSGVSGDGEVYIYDLVDRPILFKPSLTGSVEQQAQALAVLNKLAQGITSLSDTRAHIIIFAIRDRAIEPASRALLSLHGDPAP